MQGGLKGFAVCKSTIALFCTDVDQSLFILYIYLYITERFYVCVPFDVVMIDVNKSYSKVYSKN